MSRLGYTVRRWLDSHAAVEEPASANPYQVDWLRVMPFAFLHVGCLAVLWVGWSPVAVAVAVALYWLRMFAITGFYHRYFSHRSFKTSRFMQGVFAVWGATAVQRGPLWWAAHHRHHHISSDRPDDVHSPRQHGFWWSHIGWITSRANFRTRLERVRDLARFPELMFLDRFDTLVPVLLALALFALGGLLGWLSPGLGTGALQMVVWGFFVSSTVLLHGTLTINSLSHKIGRIRFVTGDDSRNSWPLAIITMGEGWHNNHHHYPNSVRQGFYWWELDLTWLGLRLFEKLGLVHDLHPVPARVLGRNRLGASASPGPASPAANVSRSRPAL